MTRLHNISYSLTCCILSVCLSLLCSCHKTAPQRPVSHSSEQDTVAIGLMRMQMRMAEEADKEVTAWIKTRDEQYAMHHLGFWYYIEKGQTTDDLLKEGQEVRVHIIEYHLNGKQICDIETSLNIGKREETRAVDEALKMMSHGMQAQLAVPWYLAYGAQGTELVPPHTNMIIDLKAY